MRERPIRFGSVAFFTSVGALWTLAVGCGEVRSLPVGASELTTGVIVYEHANFQGDSAHVTRDTADLEDFDVGPCEHSVDDGHVYNWDDCISSVRVAPGWRATLYEHPGFKGESLDLTEDASNLQLVKGTCPHDGLNDCISSIRVRMP